MLEEKRSHKQIMNLKFYKTNDISNDLLNSYTSEFNSIFNKNKSLQYFKKKYVNNITGSSYHVFLVDKNKVVGACTIIPYNYKIDSHKHLIGLAVDTFIHLDYRKKDPFILLNMYNLLKKELKKANIIAVVAVPNDNAYMYWKKVVRMKDLFSINYYLFPLNIFFKMNFNLSFLSLFIYTVFLNLNKLIFKFFKHNKIDLSFIQIDNCIEFQKQRYIDDQKIFENDNFKSVFAIVYENNIKTAYLIDFLNKKNGQKDCKSLLFSFEQIKSYNVDLILFLGVINCYQLLIFKLPKLFEPKTLNLIIDVINKDFSEILMKKTNWDFGLINFDVR